jgi:hypothetical protein
MTERNPEDAETRAELTADEKAVGSDDPEAQATEILADSDERTAEVAIVGSAEVPDVERRTSEETVPPEDQAN